MVLCSVESKSGFFRKKRGFIINKQASRKQTEVIVVGNCIVDEIIQLPYYPQEDEEMRAVQAWRTPGGNACNSSRVLARQGHRVRLVCQLAQDTLSDWLIQQLDNERIDTSFCARSKDQSTPVSSIWLNQTNGSRTIAHYRDLDELSMTTLNNLNSLTADWIHFEGRNIKPLTRFLQASPELQTIPLSLEIEKARDDIEKLLPWMSVVIVSNDYLKQKGLTATACMQRLKSYNQNLKVVCTLGSAGLLAMDQESAVIQIDAEPVKAIVDTIGAGDCFIAGLISALSRAETFIDALRYANHLAALKIQHQGFDFHV